MSVIDQLARLRREKGVTAPDVARGIGTHASNIYAIESGRRDARLSTGEAVARALGARLLVVDTGSRVSAAEAAAKLRREANPAHQTQVFLQLVADLRSASPLGKAALSNETPAPVSSEWDAAVAGVVEIELAGVGLPSPAWVHDVVGTPGAHWDPWTFGRLVPDAGDVPEPLSRRGVWIAETELEST